MFESLNQFVLDTGRLEVLFLLVQGLCLAGIGVLACVLVIALAQIAWEES